MSDVLTTGFGVLVALESFLYLLHRRKRRRLSERPEASEGTGRAIDPSLLKDAIEEVRRDYLAVRRRHRGCFHQALLKAARREVARFSYFQGKRAEDPATDPPTRGTQRHLAAVNKTC